MIQGKCKTKVKKCFLIEIFHRDWIIQNSIKVTKEYISGPNLIASIMINIISTFINGTFVWQTRFQVTRDQACDGLGPRVKTRVVEWIITVEPKYFPQDQNQSTENTPNYTAEMIINF